MGRCSFGIPQELASTLVRELGLVAAVETGTNLGDTAVFLRGLVDEVWTIELSEVLVTRARERHGDVQGIHFLLGDSGVVLPEVVALMVGPSLFWLDAHWCGGDTGGFDDQCPLMAEIAAIDRSPCAAGSCLLIDDAESFLGGPPPGWRGSDFPTFIDVVDALRATHDRHVTVLQDVIVATPPGGRPIIEAYWQGVLRRRLERERTSVGGRMRRTTYRILPSGAYNHLRRAWRGD